MKPAILALALFPSFAIAQTPSLSSAPSSDHTTIRQLINQHYHRPCPRINANSPPRPPATQSSLKTPPTA